MVDLIEFDFVAERVVVHTSDGKTEVNPTAPVPLPALPALPTR